MEVGALAGTDRLVFLTFTHCAPFRSDCAFTFRSQINYGHIGHIVTLTITPGHYHA